MKIAETPNGVVFTKQNAHPFDMMAAKVREMTGAVHGSGTALQSQSASATALPETSVPDQIKALSELHTAGILTNDEYNGKKADLLARM